MLESIARLLGDRYTVDAVTTKADCLDLLRQNTFEVIVAGERLEDGSGLELLSQAAKRWPAMLRIFSADRPRLQLLKGRLGPFELFQTLAYPIDPDRLIATLELADAAQDAHADTANIQHVVLGAEAYSEDSEDSEETDKAEPWPTPKPQPRAVPENEDPPRIAPLRRVTPSGQPLRVGQRALSGAREGRDAVAVVEAPRSRSPVPGPRRSPVQFAPVPAASAERAQSLAALDSALAEAAELAREASAALTPMPDEPESPRRTVLIAIGAAVAAGVGLFAFWTFGAHPEAAPLPKRSVQVISSPTSAPAAPVTNAPVGNESAGAGVVLSGQKTTNDSTRTRHATHHATAAAEAVGLADAKAAPITRVSNELSAAPSAAGRVSRAGSASAEPALPPETPVGMTLSAPETLTPSNPAPLPGSSAQRPANSAETGSAVAASGVARPAAVQAAPATVAAQPVAVAPQSTAAATPPPAPAAPPMTTAPAASSGAPSNHSDEPPPVVREARLIHRVNADYPSGARRDGLKGSIDLAVTVSTEGAVTDVTVTRSDPPGTFDKAAIAAVRHYRYDPRYVDGLPAQAHLQVHLDFDPGAESR